MSRGKEQREQRRFEAAVVEFVEARHDPEAFAGVLRGIQARGLCVWAVAREAGPRFTPDDTRRFGRLMAAGVPLCEAVDEFFSQASAAEKIELVMFLAAEPLKTLAPDEAAARAVAWLAEQEFMQIAQVVNAALAACTSGGVHHRLDVLLPRQALGARARG